MKKKLIYCDSLHKYNFSKIKYTHIFFSIKKEILTNNHFIKNQLYYNLNSARLHYHSANKKS